MSKRIAKMVGAACVATLWCSPSWAQEQVVSDMERPTWEFYGDVEISQVAAEAVPGGQMLRAQVIRQGENFWDSAAKSEPLPTTIEEGQIVTLGFFARAGSEGEVWVNANVGEIAAPYSTAVIGRINLTQEGGFYCLEGVSDLRLGRGDAKVTLHMGGAVQTVDLGPYVVTARSTEDGATGLPCTEYITSW